MGSLRRRVRCDRDGVVDRVGVVGAGDHELIGHAVVGDGRGGRVDRGEAVDGAGERPLGDGVGCELVAGLWGGGDRDVPWGAFAVGCGVTVTV